MPSIPRIPHKVVELLASTNIVGVTAGSGTYTGTTTLEDFNYSNCLVTFQISSASGTLAVAPFVQQYIDGNWIDMVRMADMTTNDIHYALLPCPANDGYIGLCGDASLAAGYTGVCPVSNVWRVKAVITSNEATSGVINCKAYFA